MTNGKRFNDKRFKVGTVVALDFQDGCGFMVGTIVGESYKYSAWSGVEYIYFQIQPAGQALDDRFQVTLEELSDFGVILPSRVLVTDGGIEFVSQ